MPEGSLYGPEDALQPWETEESRWESRHAWRGDEARALVPPFYKVGASRSATFDPKEIQKLADLATRSLGEAFNARRTMVRMEREISALRAALDDAIEQPGAPAEWFYVAQQELHSFAESLDSGERNSDVPAVSRNTLLNALQFLRAIPAWVPQPEVGVDPDGQIYFEWQSAARWVFTVSISPERLAYYAGLFGINRSHGVEEVTDVLPQSIRANLARFNAR
jgi:hypothetical protein